MKRRIMDRVTEMKVITWIPLALHKRLPEVASKRGFDTISAFVRSLIREAVKKSR